jgi:uncharacterized protein
MTFPQIVILFIAAILGGTLNSVAGGGSFFTFPALVFAGVPIIPANATSTVALWPGSVASVGAYRKDLTKLHRGFLIVMVGTSLIGGILGAQLLLGTSQSAFVRLLPFLLLMATLLFTFSGPITRRLRGRRVEAPAETSKRPLVGMAMAQFVIAIYGGYFGGGIGILMLATLALMGMDDINEMNGVKTLLTTCINGSAMVTFIIRGAVFWPEAILMIVGTVIGGYGGAYYARKIDQKWVRLFVMIVGFALTIYFFVQQL